MKIQIDASTEAKAFFRQLERMPIDLVVALCRAMDKENRFTLAHISKDYVSFPKQGPPSDIGLRTVTGQYLRSLRTSSAVQAGPDRVTGTIGTNLKYAAIHEFGGTIPAHDVTAKSGKALRFEIGGRVIFRKSVHIPEITMPAREPITRGINDRLPDYATAFGQAFNDCFNKRS